MKKMLIALLLLMVVIVGTACSKEDAVLDDKTTAVEENNIENDTEEAANTADSSAVQGTETAQEENNHTYEEKIDSETGLPLINIEYLDPIYSFPLKIGMSGEMTLAVDNPRALIIKLVGGDDSYSQDKAVDQFKGLLLSRLKPFIARYMVENRINIFEVDAHLEAFSSELEKMMTPEYAEYGMALKRMYVNTVVKPEGERDYEKFKALHYRKYTDVESARLEQELATIQAQTEAVKMGIEAEALAKKRQTEGYATRQYLANWIGIKSWFQRHEPYYLLHYQHWLLSEPW